MPCGERVLLRMNCLSLAIKNNLAAPQEAGLSKGQLATCQDLGSALWAELQPSYWTETGKWTEMSNGHRGCTTNVSHIHRSQPCLQTDPLHRAGERTHKSLHGLFARAGVGGWWGGWGFCMKRSHLGIKGGIISPGGKNLASLVRCWRGTLWFVNVTINRKIISR